MIRREKKWAAGLALAAFAVGAGYVYGGWMPSHGVVLAPAAVAVLVAAMILGTRRAKSVRPPIRLCRGVLESSVYVGVMLLPLLLRWTDLQWTASTLPLPQNATRIERQVQGFVQFDGWPDYTVSYTTHQPLEEVDQFYLTRLTAAGWEEDVSRRENYWPVQTNGVERRVTRHYVHGMKIMAVAVSKVSEETRVSIEPVDEPAKRLW